jgi:hypothetical protein
MLTEDEAATKWCPFNVARSTSSRCIGSECMMWQWGLKPTPPDASAPKGYCGLCNTQWRPQ